MSEIGLLNETKVNKIKITWHEEGNSEQSMPNFLERLSIVVKVRTLQWNKPLFSLKRLSPRALAAIESNPVSEYLRFLLLI